MEEKKKSGWIRAVLTGLLVGVPLALGIACAVLFWWNRFTLSVELIGQEEQFQEYGEPFQDPGVRLYLRGDKLFTRGFLLTRGQQDVTGLPEGEQLGDFTAEYHGKFLFWQGSAQRKIRLIDSVCPVISLTPLPENQPKGPYQEPGFTAEDNYDGDITDRVKSVLSPGMVRYTVVDSSGNPCTVEREIPIYDQEPPKITLEGGEDYVITLGTRYEEPGFRAEDDSDGDVTDLVEYEGEVIWWEAGQYPVTYTVTDSYMNTAEVTRTVEVVPAVWPDTEWPEKNTIYLTFDDGPGPYTRTLLDVLDSYGAKATFFVTDSGYNSAMREIVKRGHSIGIHSATHLYKDIYASPEAYFDDVHRMQQVIYDNTGVWTTLLRFPGGSSNLISRKTCEGIMTTLSTAVRDAGYQYFDWNVDSDDAGSARTAEKVYENVVDGVSGHRVCIVLQHDTHGYSVDAVEKILRWGRKNGYRFSALKESSPGFHHDVLN